MSLELRQQYDKIYQYCYFRTKNPTIAEDLTQETFLRFLQHSEYQSSGKELQYLYVIARNLCIDHARQPSTEPLDEEQPLADSIQEQDFVNHAALRCALSQLSKEDQELVLLRYVQEVPIAVLCRMYGISRFALYRKCKGILAQLQEAMGKEASPECIGS